MKFYGIRIPDNQIIYLCRIPSDVMKRYGIIDKKSKYDFISKYDVASIIKEANILRTRHGFDFKDEDDLQLNEIFFAGVELGMQEDCATIMFLTNLTDRTMFVRIGDTLINTAQNIVCYDSIHYPLVLNRERVTVEELDAALEDMGYEMRFSDGHFCCISGIFRHKQDLVVNDLEQYFDRRIVSAFNLGGKESYRALIELNGEERFVKTHEFHKVKVAIDDNPMFTAIVKTPHKYIQQQHQPKSIFQFKSQERFTNDGVLKVRPTSYNPLLSHSYIPNKYKINDLVNKKPNNINRKTYTLGIELEVECTKGTNVRNGIVNVVKTLNENNYEQKDRYFVVHDGSLDNGLEIVTHPFEINIDGVPSIIKDLQELLHFLKYNTETSSRCGLHIHIGRQSFKEDLPRKLNYVFELWNEDIMKVSRRGRENRYCKMPHLFRFDKKLMKLWNAKQSKLYDVSFTEDKYVAVNTNHNKTIEIRLWGGTQDPELISMYLELTLLLCVVVDRKTYSELKEMSLKDLIPLSNNKAFKKNICKILDIDIKTLYNKKTINKSK